MHQVYWTKIRKHSNGTYYLQLRADIAKSFTKIKDGYEIEGEEVKVEVTL